MSSDEARVILEAFENKIAVVIETLDDLKKNVATRDDLREINDAIATTQKALKATNEDLRNQGQEMALLKQQIA